MDVTSTTQSGFRPDDLHLMLQNFSKPFAKRTIRLTSITRCIIFTNVGAESCFGDDVAVLSDQFET